MSNERDLKRIEANILQSKEIVEFDKAIQRLAENRDFRAVIVDGYFKREAIRLVELKADPSMQSPASQASIISQIDAIGGLMTFLRTAGHNAKNAIKAIEQDEAMREEILEEGN